MAALLVALSVMAILATAAMPVWRQMAQREKEEELVFRGQQYARAIGLFQRKAGPGVLPPNIDVLVEQRVLRNRYRDPITGDEFQLLRPTQNAAGPAVAGQAGQAGPPAPGAGRGGAPNAPLSGPAVGGVIGVASKSTDRSIRTHNGRNHYNEWVFQYVPQTQAPGTPGVPGQPPQPGGPGQRGQPFGPTAQPG